MERFLSPVAVVRGLYFEKIGNNDSYESWYRGNPVVPFSPVNDPLPLALYSQGTLSLPALFWVAPPYLLARIQLRVIGSLWRQLRDFSKWRHQPIPIESGNLWRGSGKAWKGWRWIRSVFLFIGKKYCFDIVSLLKKDLFMGFLLGFLMDTQCV